MSLKTGFKLGITSATIGITCGFLGTGVGIAFSHENTHYLPTLVADSTQPTQDKKESDKENNADTVRMLTLLGTVMDVVHSEYVEPIKDTKLIKNAIKGMVDNLDPHSSFMDAQQLKDVQEEMAGQFGGLGLQVQSDAGHVRIVSPIDDTPAARAGIQSGDVITMVDNKSIADLSLDQAVRKMRGKPGTKITLTILRPKTGKVQNYPLTREMIHTQIVRSALYGRTGYIRLIEFDDSLEEECVRPINNLLKTSKKLLEKHLMVLF